MNPPFKKITTPHPPRRQFGLAALACAVGGLGTFGAPRTAWAAIGGLPTKTAHGDTSPEWDRLREKLFAGRHLIQGADAKVQLTAPLRAAYGASVPIKIVSKLAQTPALYVKRMVLLVDKNPSQVAAVLDITPEAGQADFETRLRVDEYSHVRVISELSNGELHLDSRFVKTSGGCSAPPNRSSPELIGKTVFKLPSGVNMQAPTSAEVTVLHPNDTGFELNNVTVMYIPPHFVRSIKVSYGGRKVFDAELDFSVSENPNLRFNFLPRGAGELKAEVQDSKEALFVGSLAVQ